MSPSVLIVEDNDTLREGMAHVLSKGGYRILEACNGIEGYECFRSRGPWDVVITDLKMDGLNGLQLIKKIRSDDPNVKCLMVSAYGTIERAIEAIKLGASDFITKPFEREALLKKVDEVIKNRAAVANDDREQLLRGRFLLSSKSPVYLEFLGNLEKALKTKDRIFVKAYAGTYVREVCSAMIRRIGNDLVDWSVPLPEVGPDCFCYRSLSKLSSEDLNALQNVRSRFVVAYHCTAQDVMLGESLRMPTLSERKEDIRAITEEILFQIKTSRGRTLWLSSDSLAWIQRTVWPGNISEVESFLTRLVDENLKDGEIKPEQLIQSMDNHLREGWFRIGVDLENCSLSEALDEVERRLIVDAFEKAGRIKTETARMLGIKTSALYYKLEKYGLL